MAVSGRVLGSLLCGVITVLLFSLALVRMLHQHSPAQRSSPTAVPLPARHRCDLSIPPDVCKAMGCIPVAGHPCASRRQAVYFGCFAPAAVGLFPWQDDTFTGSLPADQVGLCVRDPFTDSTALFSAAQPVPLNWTAVPCAPCLRALCETTPTHTTCTALAPLCTPLTGALCSLRARTTHEAVHMFAGCAAAASLASATSLPLCVTDSGELTPTTTAPPLPAAAADTPEVVCFRTHEGQQQPIWLATTPTGILDHPISSLLPTDPAPVLLAAPFLVPRAWRPAPCRGCILPHPPTALAILVEGREETASFVRLLASVKALHALPLFDKVIVFVSGFEDVPGLANRTTDRPLTAKAGQRSLAEHLHILQRDMGRHLVVIPAHASSRVQAYQALAAAARSASCQYVLMASSLYSVAAGTLREDLTAVLEEGLRLLHSQAVHIVGLRSRATPGAAISSGLKSLMGREDRTIVEAPNKLCDSFHWVENPERRWPSRFSACGTFSVCFSSAYCQWDAEPALYSVEGFSELLGAESGGAGERLQYAAFQKSWLAGQFTMARNRGIFSLG